MRTARLVLEDRSWELPVVEGSEGELGLDVTQLRARTGLVALDPSFGNTATCTSSITYTDGERGILRYRGIPIEELAAVERPDFVEVAWHLVFGRLPRRPELVDFRARIARNAALHEGFRHHFEGFPVDAPPMAMLSAMINSLACFHQDILNSPEGPDFEEATARLVSQVRTIAAYSYRKSKGLPLMYPNPRLRYCADLLHMMFSMPYDEHAVDPDLEDALNLVLLVHADHEQSCSTSAVRLVGSSMANLYASCAAGVSALWGARHGGANVAVLEMLEEIHQGRRTPEECLRQARDRHSAFRLMGFGHRVYKNYDPRASILKTCADRVIQRQRVPDPLLDIARRLEELALADPYFVERRLYPNVDFYSGIILKALGIPPSMFPVLFAIGRLPGWIAHWREQHDEPGMKIVRPRQIYTGPTLVHYLPVDER